MRIHWGKRAKIFDRGTTGGVKNRFFERGKRGKTRLAKGYLGLQGSDDETGAMDESEKPLPCGQNMESDFKRLGAESVNTTFESLTGRIAEGEEGIEEHYFL